MPTKEQLQAIVKELQVIMRIQDWEIVVEVLDGYKMAEESHYDNSGESRRSMRHKYARILINKDHPYNEPDWYLTLIHELKHVQTTEFQYVLYGFLKQLEDSPMKSLVQQQLDDLYEQQMNIMASEFAKIYPVENFNHILRGEDNAKETARQTETTG
jgi:predicted FMN-binding regulatory protein PaiB